MFSFLITLSLSRTDAHEARKNDHVCFQIAVNTGIAHSNMNSLPLVHRSEVVS